MIIYRLRKDWIAVRELPAPPDSAVILQLDDPNKRRETVITGRVEQVGPGRHNKAGELIPMDVRVGDLVYYEIEMGKARLPWDLDVRVMRVGDIAAVEQQPAGTRQEDYPKC